MKLTRDESLQPVFSADTFPKFVRAAAAAYGNDIAVRLVGGTKPDISISFAELDSRSAELARGLVGRGVGKGTRIGFIIGNSPHFALVLAAIARIGAVAVPISTLIKSNELVRVLRQSDIQGLILQRSLLGHDLVDRLCDALPVLRDNRDTELRLVEAPYLRWIVSSGNGLPAAIHHVAWLRQAADSVSEPLLREIEDAVHETDQIIEIYTSGSMALPKGVKHLHGAFLFRARYLVKMTDPQRGEQRTVPLPMFWVGGLMVFLLPGWMAGAVTVCTEGTSTSSRMAMGSVLAAEDLEALAFKPPYWALGMSETLGPYSFGDELRAPGFPLCAPIDHVADRFEVRIANEGGIALAEGDTGEIQVRGYALTAGLHKVSRDEYLTADGFYQTGDMGLIEGSRIHFIGRSGDMIKTAGSNVSPAEVEQEMQRLDGVHSAYVVGIPDEQRGQLVAAAVVARDGVDLDFESIQATLKQRLSSYKVPRLYFAILREEVPMLPSNKVARREISRMVADKLSANITSSTQSNESA